MLSCYHFMKQKLIFITKIYTKQSCFYVVDKTLNLKLSKLLYYIKMSRLFADVLIFKP